MQESELDRRKFVRIDTDSPISVSEPGNSPEVAAKLLNLSQGGIRFVSVDGNIAIGEVLEVRLSSGEDQTDVTVRVVRAELQHDGSLDVAATFVDEPVAQRVRDEHEATVFVPVQARSIAWVPAGSADPVDCDASDDSGELDTGIRFQCIGVAIEPSQLLRVRMEMRGRQGTVVGRVAWVLDRDRFRREIALTVKRGDASIMKMLEDEKTVRVREPALI